MPTAQEFVQMAIQAGYSTDDIQQFLQRASPMGKKEKQALELLRRYQTPDPEQESYIRNLAGDLDGREGGAIERIGQGIKRGAQIGLPIAAAALAAPTIGAALGLGGEGLGAAAPSIARALGLGTEGGVNLRNLVTLFNTYRRRGGAQTLAQFLSNLMREASQRQDQTETQEQPGQTQQIPQEILEFAAQIIQRAPDPRSGLFTAVRELLSPQNPLFNLARTLQTSLGQNLKDILGGALGIDLTQTRQQRQPQAGAQRSPAAQTPGNIPDFSSMSDEELFRLAQERGIFGG